jgi:hypothetical protein
MITTVNEYQYKAFAKSAANQPISVFFQRPIEPTRRRGTDHIKSAIPNPYVVARFIRSAIFICEVIDGSLIKAMIQKNKCNKAASPLINAIILIKSV